MDEKSRTGGFDQRFLSRVHGALASRRGPIGCVLIVLSSDICQDD